MSNSGSNYESASSNFNNNFNEPRGFVRPPPRARAVPPLINVEGKKNRALTWFQEMARNDPAAAHRVLGGEFGTAGGVLRKFSNVHNWKKAAPRGYTNMNKAGLEKIVKYWIKSGAPLAKPPGPGRIARLRAALGALPGAPKNAAFATGVVGVKGLASALGGEGGRRAANWILNNNRFPNKWLAVKHSSWNKPNFLRAIANANALLGRNVTRQILEAASLSGNKASNVKALNKFGGALNLYYKKQLSPKKFEYAIHNLGAHMLGYTNMNSPREIAQLLEVLKSLYKIHKKPGPPIDQRYSQTLANRLVHLLTSLFIKYIQRTPPPAKYGPHLNRFKYFKTALAKTAASEGVFTAAKLKKLSNSNAQLLRNLVNLGTKSTSDPRYVKNLAAYSAILGGAGGVAGGALTGAGLPVTGAAAAALLSPSIGRIAKLLYQLTPEGTIPTGARAAGRTLLAGAAESNAERAKWFSTHDAEGHIKKYFNMANKSNGSNADIMNISRRMFNNAPIKARYTNQRRRIPTPGAAWTIFKPSEQKLISTFTKLQEDYLRRARDYGARVANYLMKAQEANGGNSLNAIATKMMNDRNVPKNVNYLRNTTKTRQLSVKERNLLTRFTLKKNNRRA